MLEKILPIMFLYIVYCDNKCSPLFFELFVTRITKKGRIIKKYYEYIDI